MSFIDVVILIVTLGLLGSILFFNLHKGRKKDKCCGCPYREKCKTEANNCDVVNKETAQNSKTNDIKKEG